MKESGPPYKYYPIPTMLNFRDRTRTGVPLWYDRRQVLMFVKLCTNTGSIWRLTLASVECRFKGQVILIPFSDFLYTLFRPLLASVYGVFKGWLMFIPYSDLNGGFHYVLYVISTVDVTLCAHSQLHGLKSVVQNISPNFFFCPCKI